LQRGQTLAAAAQLVSSLFSHSKVFSHLHYALPPMNDYTGCYQVLYYMMGVHKLCIRRRFESTSGERPSSSHCTEAQDHAQREKPSSKGQQGTHGQTIYIIALYKMF